MEKKYPVLDHYNYNNKTVLSPTEKQMLLSERIQRAKDAKAAAQMALVGRPKPNPPPLQRSNYTTLEWAGKTYKIRRPFE